jgi:cyclopropane fatty-acyl-phospholipid synthase-like methyltransferase
MWAHGALRFALLVALAGCAGGGAPAQHPEPTHGAGHPGGDAYHRRFEDAEHWARVFDDPARDAWQKPEAVISALTLAPSARVADLGAGTGYFAVRIARRVPEGRVYAVDIESDMVRHLGERATREGLANLTPVLATPDEPRIPEPVDLVLVVDTYHHIADRVTYFRRLSESLRPGGRLAIIDFTPESPIGPPAEHRIPPEAVAQELAQAGYAKVQALALLPNQYFLVFEPEPSRR